MWEQLKEFIAPALPVLRWIGIGLGIYAILFWLSLAIWTYEDIRARSQNLLWRLLSTLLVLLTGGFGVVVYLLLRPKEKLAEVYARSLERAYILQEIEERPVCPTCQRGVEPDFVLCPYCYTPLKKKCPHCEHLMDLSWQRCPYCGT
ncbi:MAG: zinc ribbon domain-containing protein [Chloroflexia bacterium]